MRTITLWAYRHQVAARVLIICIHVYLVIAAMVLAGWWQKNETVISIKLCLLIILISIAAVCVLHILKRRKHWPGLSVKGYAVVRVKYFFVALAAFVSMLAWFYTNSHVGMRQYEVQGSFPALALEKTQKPQKSNYADEMQYYTALEKYYRTLSTKQLTGELKTTLKASKHASKGEAGDTWLIILIILGALVASLALLALACEISCAGSDAGAIALSVLGLAGIIWGAIALIKSVKRKALKRNQQALEANPI
ncbi:MAG TPA: hypothetical protein VLC98_14365 [Phnomibacter sp.]|nr:hypothetical protein [Phnomibacter sp.]